MAGLGTLLVTTLPPLPHPPPAGGAPSCLPPPAPASQVRNRVGLLNASKMLVGQMCTAAAQLDGTTMLIRASRVLDGKHRAKVVGEEDPTAPVDQCIWMAAAVIINTGRRLLRPSKGTPPPPSLSTPMLAAAAARHRSGGVMTETGCAGARRAVLGLLLSYAGVRVVEGLGCWLERLGDQGVGADAVAGQQLRPSARIAVGAPAAAEGGSRLHTGYCAQGHVQGRGAAGAAPGEKSWRGGLLSQRAKRLGVTCGWAVARSGRYGVRTRVVSGPFPSWNRSILTEIYLCHACSDHEFEDHLGIGPY
jgi:hypothetical protein